MGSNWPQFHLIYLQKTIVFLIIILSLVYLACVEFKSFVRKRKSLMVQKIAMKKLGSNWPQTPWGQINPKKKTLENLGRLFFWDWDQKCHFVCITQYEDFNTDRTGVFFYKIHQIIISINLFLNYSLNEYTNAVYF